MKLPQVSSYEIKVSKTGHEIPVVNNIHLHSIYDPLREADEFIKKNHKFLKSRNNILFLGLGFGYHIDCASKVLDNYHNGNYSIVVIEPNLKTAQDCISIRKLNNKSIELYVKKTVESLYFNRKLVSFLLKKPSIISHPPSFNLYKDYFKEFLTYKSPQSISWMKNIPFDKDLRKYLNELDPKSEIDSYIKNELMKKREVNNENEYLMLALYHLAQRDNTKVV